MKKTLFIGLCVLVLAAVLFAVAFRAFVNPPFLNPQAPASLREESFIFMRDVVGFDMTNYRVVDSHFWPQIDVASSNGLPLFLIKYELESSDDEASVDIFYTKANETYIHEPYFGVHSNTLFSPAYPTAKVLNWTKSFLERYQSFQSNASYVFEIRKTLDSIEHIKPLNVTKGDIKLQITIRQFTEQEIYTTLAFSHANSTAQDSDNQLTFEFHNGVMLDFWDWYE